MKPVRRGLPISIDLRPGEGSALALLFLHALLKGISTVFFETAANTRFLVDFGVELLPWIYIATAAASVLLGAAYVGADRRSSPMQLFVGIFILLNFAAAAFYAALLLGGGSWISLLLMVWRDVHWVLLEIEFWALAGLIFNIRQSKRLLGPLAAGGILGYVAGGLVTPVVVGFLGIDHLLGLSLGGSLGCMALLFQIRRTFPESFQKTASLDAADGGANQSAKSLRAILRQRYVVLILAITTTSILGYYILDFVFYQQVEAFYPGEAAIANFFGLFAAVYGVTSLATSGLLTGPLLARFGIVCALLAIPLTGAFGVAAAGIAFHLNLEIGLIFWVLIVTKMLNEVLGEAVQAPTFRILYQPFSPVERLKVVAVRESMVMPAAGGFAGALLLLMTEVLGWGFREFAFLYLSLVAIVVALVLSIRSAYVQKLAQSVDRRLLGGEDFDLSDPATMEVLRQGLDSAEPRDVINALRLLEMIGTDDVIATLLLRLDHHDDAVRAYVLERLESLAPEAAAPVLEQRLKAESQDRLKGLVLLALTATAGEAAVELVSTYLDDESEAVRLAAITGLLRHGGLGGVLAVSPRLNELLASDLPEERVAAARALGASAVSGFYHPLLGLLEDTDPGVRRAAITAAAQLRHPRLIAPLVVALEDSSQRAEAESALVAIGRDALPQVLDAFTGAREEGEQIRLLRLAVRLGGEAAEGLLMSCVAAPSRKLRHIALRLLAADAQPVSLASSAPNLSALLQREVRELIDDFAARATLEEADGEEGAVSLLTGALDREIADGRDRILVLLALDRPDPLLPRARELLRDEDAERRAQGLEILDNLLPRGQRAELLPLFDDGAQKMALARTTHQAVEFASSVDAIVAWILEESRHGAWTLACALMLATAHRSAALSETIRRFIQHSEPMVRETAAWALLSRQDTDVDAEVERLESSDDACVARLCAAWRAGRPPGAPRFKIPPAGGRA